MATEKDRGIIKSPCSHSFLDGRRNKRTTAMKCRRFCGYKLVTVGSGLQQRDGGYTDGISPGSNSGAAMLSQNFTLDILKVLIENSIPVLLSLAFTSLLYNKSHLCVTLCLQESVCSTQFYFCCHL